MVKIPGSVVKRSSNFPEGHFRGKIAESKLDQNPDGSIGNFSCRLIENTLVDGEVEPGARICFVRVPVWWTTKNAKGKDTILETADVAEDEELLNSDDTPFALRNAVGQFAQLAAALGVATVLEDGGVELGGTFGFFIDRCKDGEFDGETVDFIVVHRKEKDKETKKLTGRVFEDVTFVFPEAEEEEEQEEQEEEEEEVPEDEQEKSVVGKARQKAGSGRKKFARKK